MVSVQVCIFAFIKREFIDLKKIRKEANEILSQLCWQTVFDRCHQTLESFVVKMTERFGRMRSALSKVCNQASGAESLPQQRKLCTL